MAATAKIGWKVFGGLSVLAAGVIAKRAVDTTWGAVTGQEPPANPASPETTWPEAVGWALASGAAVGLARLAAARGAARYWQESTGRLPPGLATVTP
jgi:hypothetical protein